MTTGTGSPNTGFGKVLGALIIAAAIVATALILSDTYKKRNRANDIINVTGLGRADFVSDLIVWGGSFTRKSMNLQETYAALEQDRQKLESYLISKGLSKDAFIFTAIDISKETEYVSENNNSRSIFTGYRLTQNVQIESKEVDKIENISRQVSELINTGIEFSSRAPEYYYTKLAELKIKMVASATEDGRLRAVQIAEKSNAGLGGLRYAQMGIFQITAQNSDENYSWGGAFNTASKNKTATVTMKLQFAIQ